MFGAVDRWGFVVSIAELGPALVSEALIPEPAQPCRAVERSVLDTTELRWFFPGPLPTEVGGWFTGSTGVAEQRCDTYLLDGRRDIGVKRRFRETLELKVRQALDERVELGDGLAGSLELWRKWSPAEGLVEYCTDGRWIDVHKSIIKRRFLIDGTEVAFSSDPHVTGVGCDVEVAEVTVGAVQVWTFACAAFGPPASRPEALLASWDALVAAAPCPESFEPRTGRAMGYPEWLAITTSRDPAERNGRRLQQHCSLTSCEREPPPDSPVSRRWCASW